jgi:hypothetical protein
MTEANSTQNNQDSQLVTASQRGLDLRTFDDLLRFAEVISKSGLAPKGFDRVEAIIIAIQMGAELGLAPLSSLQSIAVINGRPGIFGDAALALVRGSGLCAMYEQRIEGEEDNRRAVVTTQRRNGDKITTTFSVADAKKARLWGKQGPWSEYPDRMLTFRARGFNLRDNFGDVLKGFKTTEELADYPIERTANAVEVPLTRSETDRRLPPHSPVSGAIPKDNGNAQKTSQELATYQGVIDKAYTTKAKESDKDQREWFNAESNGRELWTRKPDIGQELLDSLDSEMVMTLSQSKKFPNKFQVMSIREPDRTSTSSSRADVDLEPQEEEIPFKTTTYKDVRDNRLNRRVF